ncbi:hypothetical protein V5279_43560 [Bradyrhizobium sp. 26S5]|uniref:hypothetical protein n=1 Tax=Bradyrhizobium sp. 26S5 TaxID=3139729 RepID=UPI0030D2A1AD
MLNRRDYLLGSALRKLHGGDLKFAFLSHEYNGLNRGPTGDTRPHVERTFQSFTDAEKENGRSRIWLGWQFDADAGIKQGNSVADHILGNALQKI